MKRVVKTYNKIAREIDNTVKCKKVAFDWSCYPIDRVINIPQAVTEQGEHEFMQSIYNLIPSDKVEQVDIIPDFMWSFLHEMGHIQCEHTSHSSDWLRKLTSLLAKIGLGKIANHIYFNMKEEKQASQWAVDYALHNTDKVIEYTNQLAKKYLKYYRKVLTIE